MPFKLGPFTGLLPVRVGISAPQRAVIDPNIKLAKFSDNTSLGDIASDYELVTLAIPELLNIDLFGLYTGSTDKVITDANRVIPAYKMLFPATPLFAGLTRDAKNLELNYTLLALSKGEPTMKFIQWLTTVAVTKAIDDLNKPNAVFDRIKLGVTTVPNVTVSGQYCDTDNRVSAEKYPAILHNFQQVRWFERVPVWYAGVVRNHITNKQTTTLRFPEEFSPAYCDSEIVALRFQDAQKKIEFTRQATPVLSFQASYLDPVAAELVKKSNEPYGVNYVRGMCPEVTVTVENEDLLP